jgi:hypothetical protein
MTYTLKQKKALAVGMLHAWRVVTEAFVGSPAPRESTLKLFFSRKARFYQILELGRLRGLNEASELLRDELDKMK